MVKTLFAKLAPLVTKESPLEPARGLPRKVVWTKPELICEVRFANWTEEGRLRAPVFLGLREDLDPPAAPRVALLDASLKEAEITIDGHRLKFTNLDKLFYPKDGYRKRDLLNYYDAVAPLLVPHLQGPAAVAEAVSRTASTSRSSFRSRLRRAFRSGCTRRSLTGSNM